MKFTEEKLEEAILELMAAEGYPQSGYEAGIDCAFAAAPRGYPVFFAAEGSAGQAGYRAAEVPDGDEGRGSAAAMESAQAVVVKGHFLLRGFFHSGQASFIPRKGAEPNGERAISSAEGRRFAQRREPVGDSVAAALGAAFFQYSGEGGRFREAPLQRGSRFDSEDPFRVFFACFAGRKNGESGKIDREEGEKGKRTVAYRTRNDEF